MEELYGPENYYVQYFNSSLSIRSDDVNMTSVNITNLLLNTTYYYYVVAENADGSTMSETVSFTVPALSMFEG